jgi:sarcosine oxidase subunit beta
VTIGEIEAAIGSGLRTIEELKRYTGLGTGPCQGKECLAALARCMAADPTCDPPLAFTTRPPLENVSFGALACVPEALLIERAKQMARSKKDLP